MSKNKGTKTEPVAEQVTKGIPASNRVIAALAKFAAKGAEPESLSYQGVEAYPIDQKPLIGLYCGEKLMKDKEGVPVKDMNNKDWFVHIFVDAETGETVFLNKSGMLDKKLAADTELGQNVYFIESKGKQEMKDGTGRSAYVYKISRVKAEKPLTVEEMTQAAA